MLKKRLIFTLLYNNGQFMLSRNFRLQKVGDLKWLKANYNFSYISRSIDELIVLNVTRGEKKLEEFCAALKLITDGCFVPIAAGGGVKTVAAARDLLRAGADKIVVNSALYDETDFIGHLASEFGQQCIVASVDIKHDAVKGYQACSANGSNYHDGSAAIWIEKIVQGSIGELYLNSIDRDGTGQGYDFSLLNLMPANMSKPIIMAGGVGNVTHLVDGLSDSRVDAVATAHLFNFVGDGLQKARQKLISEGFKLPLWDGQLFEQHLGQEHIEY